MHAIDKKRTVRTVLLQAARDSYNREARLLRGSIMSKEIKVRMIRHMREYGLLVDLSEVDHETLSWRCLIGAQLLAPDVPTIEPIDFGSLSSTHRNELLNWIVLNNPSIMFTDDSVATSCVVTTRARSILRQCADDTVGARVRAMYECKLGHERVQSRETSREYASSVS